jgi:hypothetical protein
MEVISLVNENQIYYSSFRSPSYEGEIMGRRADIPEIREYRKAFGEKTGKDFLEDLGNSTWIKLQNFIKEGNNKQALEVVKYLLAEGKSMHDLLFDGMYVDLDYIAKTYGEDEIPKILRYAYDVIGNGVYRTLSEMTVEELVYKHAEIKRSIRSGSEENGDIEIWEEKDKYVVIFDPCGSGGRMRRGSKLDGTPPRTKPPYNLGVTSRPYPWSWSKPGVPYYCVHCCVWAEQIFIETRGYPLRITDYSGDPLQPCSFLFYKRPELIPEVYFERVGKVKNAAGFHFGRRSH